LCAAEISVPRGLPDGIAPDTIRYGNTLRKGNVRRCRGLTITTDNIVKAAYSIIELTIHAGCSYGYPVSRIICPRISETEGSITVVTSHIIALPKFDGMPSVVSVSRYEQTRDICWY